MTNLKYSKGGGYPAIKICLDDTGRVTCPHVENVIKDDRDLSASKEAEFIGFLKTRNLMNSAEQGKLWLADMDQYEEGYWPALRSAVSALEKALEA